MRPIELIFCLLAMTAAMLTLVPKIPPRYKFRVFPGLVVLAWVQAKRGQLEHAQTSLDEAARLYPELSAGYVSHFLGKRIAGQMQQAGLDFAQA